MEYDEIAYTNEAYIAYIIGFFSKWVAPLLENCNWTLNIFQHNLVILNSDNLINMYGQSMN